ncbi:hypothetical protein C0Z01_13495 [Photobacterium kishitanii]|uniref:hypothetical protein n=1 Tax=Photobacterium kishitanii TaxID=318456 RepID=UPI0007EF4C9E|nr:hypothetical protein [Photobacterium kishitanii]OBU22869.1 hypothetical protein AYY22_07845 [Photobacterium kishitanii]PSW68737.1 hypothetical protein C0Z01_13495 [Photobacterium kishitanii]
MKYLYAKTHNVKCNFTYISWSQLTQLVINPPLLTTGISIDNIKKKSPIIAAHNAKDKTKESALNNDNFTLLRLDLDDYNDDIEAIKNKLKDLGIESYIIHSTANHKKNGKNRYRLFIELSIPLIFDDWSILETYLAFIFQADDCSSRPQQIMYLPYKFHNYEICIGTGKALHVFKSELYQLAKEFCVELEKNYDQQQEQSYQVNQPYDEHLVGKQISIIDLINKAYVWDDLLLKYKYKRQGKGYLPPESNSKIAGAYLLVSKYDGKERYYSHHSSDPCAIGKAIDIFDFICIRSYGGDKRAALKEIAETIFPKVSQHNKKEWIIAQHNKNLCRGVAI